MTREDRDRSKAPRNPPHPQQSFEDLQVLDILRCAGMWDEANAQSDTFSVSELNKDIGPIIAFQRGRIAAHDRACYSADQAYAASETGSA